MCILAEALVRKWIVDILQQHSTVLSIAVRQRAKFEGWLKFELAAYAQQQGAINVQVEAPSDKKIGLSRSDVTFYLDDIRYDIELKTPNANWQMIGVANTTRPITQNFAEIVNDGKKLRTCSGQGIVAFVLFPIPADDTKWEAYLKRLALALSLSLSVQEHTVRHTVLLGNEHIADVIVCCFDIPKMSLNTGEADAEAEPSKPQFELAEMSSLMPADYQVVEEGFGSPVGKEEW